MEKLKQQFLNKLKDNITYIYCVLSDYYNNTAI